VNQASKFSMTAKFESPFYQGGLINLAKYLQFLYCRPGPCQEIIHNPEDFTVWPIIEHSADNHSRYPTVPYNRALDKPEKMSKFASKKIDPKD